MRHHGKSLGRISLIWGLVLALAFGLNLGVGIKSVKADAGPVLLSAVAVAGNNLVGIQRGDKVVLTWSEPVLYSFFESEINSVLTLSNGHSWLDGSNHLYDWSNSPANTIVLSVNESNPTVAVGDTITVNDTGDCNVVSDANMSVATGTVTITGSF
jgi:hypothetical protein